MQRVWCRTWVSVLTEGEGGWGPPSAWMGVNVHESRRGDCCHPASNTSAFNLELDFCLVLRTQDPSRRAMCSGCGVPGFV